MRNTAEWDNAGDLKSSTESTSFSSRKYFVHLKSARFHNVRIFQTRNYILLGVLMVCFISNTLKANTSVNATLPEAHLYVAYILLAWQNSAIYNTFNIYFKSIWPIFFLSICI